jgi:Acyclic terpene utilisation family protein AtuA
MASKPDFTKVKVFVPGGQLGAGVRPEEVDAALERGMDVMAMDAGSTDSGAAYLATGTSKNSRDAVKADLLLLMAAQHKTKVPLIIGSAGQAGGDLNVDWTVDIVLEIAREHAYRPKIAALYSEQSAATIKAKNAAGKVRPLPPLGPLADATIDECRHIVALMGPEPYIAALEGGADIIIGGRSTDTAVLAAFPLWKGAPIGPSWHAGKTGECGSQCTANTILGSGVFLTIDKDGFEVEPLHAANRCTVHSVSAHMLYENSNPFRLIEPGGVLNVCAAKYQQITDTRVRVTGSVWNPQPYTMKLEGAAGGLYQTIMIVGNRRSSSTQQPRPLPRPDASRAGGQGAAHDGRGGREVRYIATNLWLERGVRPAGPQGCAGASRGGRDVRHNSRDAGSRDPDGKGVQPLLLPYAAVRWSRVAKLRLPVHARRHRTRSGVRVQTQSRG